MEQLKIPFNKPYLAGKELKYIKKAVELGQISGDGFFTKKCHSFFETRYDFRKTLLTTSCTDALEMAAILCDVKPGDEIIVPSFTFVSTANAFVLRGAKIIFADSRSDHPNIDADGLEQLINHKTKAIVVVHYGGIACEMDKIMTIAKKNELFVIEDAAQSIDSFYKDQPLGSLGHFSTFSFHETKNIISGEGGMLVLNDKTYIKRAEIIREKGTNRSSFFRGEIDKYGWVDIGSSFLPSELNAAFLFAQLESLDTIQEKRKVLFRYYHEHLKPLADNGYFSIPGTPVYATNNAHIFYLVCTSLKERNDLIEHLKSKGIYAVFHYLPLHQSDFFKSQFNGSELPNALHFSEKIIRLPLYPDLTSQDQDYIITEVKRFYIR